MAVVPVANYPTVRSVLIMALKDAGVCALGQQPSADQINESFLRYCWMLDMWSVKRWMSWHLQDVSAVSQGQLYFTVGRAGNINYNDSQDFNSPDFSVDFMNQHELRPPQIESAFARLITTVGLQTDFPLYRIPSYEDYGRIRLKGMTNFPTHYFYDPAVPLGKVYFWPIPQAGLYEMHILVRQPLYKPATADDVILFPPEYVPALELNLAKWLRMAYKMPQDPSLDAMAKNALNSIKVNNTQIPELVMPGGLARGHSRYNIFSDEP